MQPAQEAAPPYIDDGAARTARKAAAVLRACRAQPAFFFEHILGCKPWNYQLDIANSVRDNPHTFCKSAHSVGKDWIAARVIQWFLSTHRPSKVITTAPTDRQVRLILWSELATANRQARMPLGGTLLQQELRFASDHFAVGFSARDYDPNAFAGFHSESVLVILDEADGISDQIREAVLSLLAGGHARLLEIGNPLTPTGTFAKRFTGELGNKITISAFDTPNFVAFGLEQQDFETGDWQKKIGDQPLPAPYLITPEWVHDRFVESGRSWSDPYIRSRVLAQFPMVDADAIFALSYIEAACTRQLPIAKDAPRILACDVARFGDDETVIGMRIGDSYRRLAGWRGQDTAQTTNRLIALARDHDADQIRVDDDGVGGGVTDGLREKLPLAGGSHVKVLAMRGGAAAEENEKFVNCRAEWHWQLRQRFIDGRVDIDGQDGALQSQLCAIRVERYDPKGRVVIEPKDKIKKRLGRSPDDSDTCVYAFAEVKPAPPPQGMRF